MKFSPPLCVLIFALICEFYRPFSEAQHFTTNTEDDTTTTTTTRAPRTRRTRSTMARFSFNGVDYHEYLGKFTKGEDMDCSLRYLKCYLYTPLHWEGCSWDWHSYTFQDIYSACQVDLLNCLNTHYLKTENADWTSNYMIFDGYGHRCKMSRGYLDQNESTEKPNYY